jgi:hypothetical protein
MELSILTDGTTTREEDIEEIKTTLRLQKKLVRQFKHIAADEDTTITALVEQAMKEFLIKKQKKTTK